MKSLAPTKTIFAVLAFQQCVTDSFDTVISYWKHGLLQRDRLLVSATDCPHQRGHVSLSVKAPPP
ncbi:hypothetical protein ACRRTK_005223 [Alexandromys fortis]